MCERCFCISLCEPLHCIFTYKFTHSSLLLLHPFNGLCSRTTWVSLHQKGKPFWILLEQEIVGWQWHQLDHMQIICTTLQTDNHASTSSLTNTTDLMKMLLQNWKEMTHEWLSGPLKFVVSAPVQLVFFSLYSKLSNNCALLYDELEMWASAQRDGRPAEYRWRSL